jgi:hypothetical protein
LTLLAATLLWSGGDANHRNVIPHGRHPGAQSTGPLDKEAQAMTIEARIRELGNRHRNLDTAIQKETTHPATDPLYLKSLKLRKLRLKEQIAGLERQSG